jgi:hypothetical protein
LSSSFQERRRQGRQWTYGVAVLFALAVIGLVIYSSFGNAANRVEVCITFGGRQACRTARARDRDAALRTATDNTCAQLASGMDAVNQCTHTPPDRVTWLKP